MTSKRTAIVFVLACTWVAWARGEAPETIPADRFLELARRPFTQNAWGQFRGRVQHRGPEGRYSMDLRLSLLLRRDFLRAQIVLDSKTVYNIMQVYYKDGLPNVTISEPRPEPEHGLQDLGIEPSDITFSFLYWQLEREHEAQEVRGHRCRVLELKHPETGDRVRAWFSAEHAFPLRVRTVDGGTSSVPRVIEFTEFKKEGELWYVKNLRLSKGTTWKTQVTFSRADMALAEEKPPPPSLFLPEHLPAPKQ